MESESADSGDEFEMTDPAAWYYSFKGHRVNTIAQIKVKENGARKYYKACLIKIDGEDEDHNDQVV